MTGKVVLWCFFTSEKIHNSTFFKWDGNVTKISHLLFHVIWKNYILYWDLDKKSWIVNFFTREKTPQNNFSSQNFSVENNYFYCKLVVVEIEKFIFFRLFGPALHSWVPTCMSLHLKMPGRKRKGCNYGIHLSWSVFDEM